MLQAHVTPLPFALVIGIHIVCLTALTAIFVTKSKPNSGWKLVGPSGSHWFCFVGSWAFSALITWVWLFVGSARRDAESQMLGALALIAAFGLAAAFSGLYMAHLQRTALQWRGAKIQWRQRGRDILQDMRQFDAYRRAWSGTYHLRFHGGDILKLDMYAKNAEDLAVAISERLGIEIE